MNPRASDRERGFQDTNIAVGDVRLTLKLGATLGAEMNMYYLPLLKHCVCLGNKNIVLTQFPGKDSHTIADSRTS